MPVAETYSVTKNGKALKLVSVTTGPGPVTRNVYFVSGSGCTSLTVFLKTYFKNLPAGYRIYGLEKEGVKQGDIGISCSVGFWENYTYPKMLARNREALKIANTLLDKPVSAIIGVSEGGPIAAELAAGTPEIRSLVMVASGGMPQRRELEILAAQRGKSSQIKKLFSQIAASPDSVETKTLGMSHRYWSSVLDFDPAPALKQLSQRTLIVIGENDKNVPVASAKEAENLIPHATLVLVPGAGHTFSSPKGNMRSEVMAAIDRFLEGEGVLEQENTRSK